MDAISNREKRLDYLAAVVYNKEIYDNPGFTDEMKGRVIDFWLSLKSELRAVDVSTDDHATQVEEQKKKLQDIGASEGWWCIAESVILHYARDMANDYYKERISANTSLPSFRQYIWDRAHDGREPQGVLADRKFLMEELEKLEKEVEKFAATEEMLSEVTI